MKRSNTFSKLIAIINATVHGKSALTPGCEKVVLISDSEVKF
ncbi:hypothetical protein [Methanosarcina sp. UBA5]|nr:hypothetical protein [Methanosarcina sp. UBA5]